MCLLHYKTAGMDTENSTFPLVKPESDADVLDDERVCALCLRIVSCEFSSEDFKESVRCNSCVGSLDTHMDNILNVKEEINDICDEKVIEDLPSIKLEEVEIKSEGSYDDTTSHNVKDEPVDCTSECQPEYIEIASNSTIICKRKQIYKCDSCDYKTNQRRKLVQHQQSHRDVLEEQMYMCDSCDFKTKRKQSLDQHQLRHLDVSTDQIYPCKLCGYKSKTEKHFTQHQLRHKANLKKKIYQCDTCDFKTHNKGNLKTHQLLHKNVPEDQMYKCDLCEYKTSLKKYLARHQLTHKKFSLFIYNLHTFFDSNNVRHVSIIPVISRPVNVTNIFTGILFCQKLIGNSKNTLKF